MEKGSTDRALRSVGKGTFMWARREHTKAGERPKAFRGNGDKEKYEMPGGKSHLYLISFKAVQKEEREKRRINRGERKRQRKKYGKRVAVHW